MKLRFFILVLLLAVALMAADRPPIGTNLAGLNYWSTEFAFLDAFKTSGAWTSLSRTWQEDTRPIDLDEHGWVRSLLPDQIVRTLMFCCAGLRYPAGRYVVEYEGSGTIGYSGGATRVESSSGRDVILVDPSRGGIELYITSVVPANYLRNIRVSMPVDAPPGEIFYPPFLDRIKNYKVIRFMNWMLGENSQINFDQREWSDRPTLQDARWTVKGAPVETMVALANRLGASPWFNIPHLSSDDYVRRFAELVRNTLDPSLKVYVEDSNEVWNGQYPQARYAREQGLALGLSTNPQEAQIRYHALRSTHIFSIFEQVFPKERLVRVLGSWADVPWTSETALTFGDTLSHTDALAIAPYFGYLAQELGAAAHMDLDQLMAALSDSLMPRALDSTRRQVALARRYGVPVIAYEGGQSLVGAGQYRNDAALNALFDAANRDPRIGAIYSQYLAGWVEAGGQLFVHYNNCERYGPYGRWGSLENLDQPRGQAPKYDALQRFIEGN